jgi:hypothetical protein
MASIYEKPPHFILEKTWDEKTRLPETYKLQSSDSQNKFKAKVYQDSGKLGVKFGMVHVWVGLLFWFSLMRFSWIRCSLLCLMACQSAINEMLRNISLLNARLPGLLPKVE